MVRVFRPTLSGSPCSFSMIATTLASQESRLRGLRGDGRAVFQLAAAGMAVLQGLGIDMHHDLLAVAAGEFLRTRGQEALGHDGECLDPALAGAVQVIR